MIPLLLFLFIVVAFYVYSIRNHGYWAQRNIKHDHPVPLLGNHTNKTLGLKCVSEFVTDIYRRYPDEKVVGYYRGNEPVLVLRDLEVIRQIMSVDFLYFYNRGLLANPKKEFIAQNLLSSEGDSWKLLRSRLTPAFTGAKIRAMYPLIVRCAEKLQEKVSTGGEYKADEIMARYSIETIGACGFGIEMDTINDEQSRFRKLGKQVLTNSWMASIVISLVEIFPEVRRYIYFYNNIVKDMILQILVNVRKSRNCKPSGRNDFIDLLLELETQGKIVGESIERTEPDGSPIQVEMTMDVEVMAAQVFIFFAAGFQTTATTLSYTLYELALNPEIQEKVHAEIDKVMLKHGKLSYDAVSEMLYLDMVFKEAMRKFPPGGYLPRVCMKKYKFPNLDLTIDPGVRIIIPVQAIHMDEKNYDNPEEFRPERFTPEAVKQRHKHSYLPFGEGPRYCIGVKLGHMQALAGLVAILHKFKVEPSANTPRKIKLIPGMNLVQGIKGGLPMLFTVRIKD